LSNIVDFQRIFGNVGNPPSSEFAQPSSSTQARPIQPATIIPLPHGNQNIPKPEHLQAPTNNVNIAPVFASSSNNNNNNPFGSLMSGMLGVIICFY
jgi:hypothetical protein